jgi:hypothetical protein
MLFETDGAGGLVAVVENDGDASLCDAGLSALVDEVLRIAVSCRYFARLLERTWRF